MLKLYFLGTPRFELDGTVINLGRRKATALLAYLALNPQLIARDSLAGLLWGDYDQKRARADLRNTLYAINKKLGDQWLNVERETVSIAADADIWIDVEAVRDLLSECRTHGHHPDEVCLDCLPLLASAFELYQDDFLAGFSISDAAEFENWQLVQREYLRMELNRIYEKLVRSHSARQEFEEAIGYAQDWLQMDVCNEDAHSYLMSLYAWSGQRSAAINQYQYCEQVLATELETEPFEETVDLYHDILDNQLPVLPTIYYPQMDSQADEATSSETAPLRHNLAPQPTPFLGRTAELDKIAENLGKASCRLISIIGLGGMGKTRLAIQAGFENLAEFADGVFFVGLIGANNRQEISQAIAEALSYQSSDTNQPLEPQLLDYLKAKELVLVLDNFEHLLAEKEIINTLLEATEQLKIMLTSRMPLDLKAEWKFDLQGMVIEQDSALVENSAIQLFIENGQRVLAEFSPTAPELETITQICSRLDGIPLAIELTTSWLRLLSPAEILTELSQDLAFLETHHSDTPERHRSLEATFNHSWDLLSAAEQDAFARLSVFRGGFTRESAATVADAKLNTLSSLAHKSLVKRNAQGRYEIHEMLRQFAERKLVEDMARQLDTLGKFGTYYANFLYEREDRLKGSDQVAAEAEIRAEIENIRDAFGWMADNHRLSLLDKLLHGLSLFYGYQDWYEEGVLYMQKIVDICEKAIIHATDSAFMYRLLGRTLAYQASWLSTLTQEDRAQVIAQRSISLLEDTDAFMEKGSVYRTLALILRFQDEFTEAEIYYDKSLAAYQQAEDMWGIAGAYEALGRFQNFSGNYGIGKPHYETALKIAREIGNPALIADIATSLGWLEVTYSGDFDRALTLGLEAITIFEEIRIIPFLLEAYRMVGSTYIQQGEFEQAWEYLSKAVPLAREFGSSRMVVSTLVDLGVWAGESGRNEQCRDYFAEAIEIAHDSNYDQVLPMLYGNLAEVYLMLDDDAQAENALEKSLALTNVLLVNVTTASNYSRLGLLRMKRGDLAGSEEAYRDALDLTVKNELIIESLSFLTDFAQLRHKQGFSAESLAYLYYVLGQSLSTAATLTDAQNLVDEIAPQVTPVQLDSTKSQAQTFDLQIFIKAD